MAVPYLKSISVDTFEKPETIVCVRSNDAISSAIQSLTSHDILCAPVLDDSGYLGLVDMASLVSDFLEHLNPPSSKEQANALVDDLISLQQFEGKTVADMAETSEWAEFQPIISSATLFDACKLLGNKHLHRLPVLNQEGVMVNIITQSAVIRVLAEHLDKLGPEVHQTLESLQLATRKDVVTAPASATTAEVFMNIRKHKIHAVPIVDEDGGVIGNLSVRDVRDLTVQPRLYRYLRAPVTEFIANRVPDKHRSEMHPAISCHPSSTLAQVIKKLAASRIHRMYVVDDEHKPIRVLSLGDILAFLTKA